MSSAEVIQKQIEFRQLPLEQKLEAIYMRLVVLEAEKKKPRPQGYMLKDVAGMFHVSYPTVYKWCQVEGYVMAGRNTRLSWEQIKELEAKYDKQLDESYM